VAVYTICKMQYNKHTRHIRDITFTEPVNEVHIYYRLYTATTQTDNVNYNTKVILARFIVYRTILMF
jgi:hypothetical protein